MNSSIESSSLRPLIVHSTIRPSIFDDTPSTNHPSKPPTGNGKSGVSLLNIDPIDRGLDEYVYDHKGKKLLKIVGALVRKLGISRQKSNPTSHHAEDRVINVEQINYEAYNEDEQGKVDQGG